MILVVTSIFHFFNLILNVCRSVGDSGKSCSPLSASSESVKLIPVSQRPKVRLTNLQPESSIVTSYKEKARQIKKGRELCPTLNLPRLIVINSWQSGFWMIGQGRPEC